MTLKRPEGLSPCYASLASPDIPDSFIFKWTFRGANSSDYQSKFTVQLLSEDLVILKTMTRVTGETQLTMDEFAYTGFEPGTWYYWTVTVYGRTGEISEKSVGAKFKYDYAPETPAIVWNHLPKPGDTVVQDTYFEEIKSNVQLILSDYDGTENGLGPDVERLFTGQLVPAREDFKVLERVIDFISTQLEGVPSVDIDGPVLDGLGVSDLEVIRKHLMYLITVKPKPVEALSFNVPTPDMYDVHSLTATSASITSRQINLAWQVERIPSYDGTFVFDKLSESRDVRYYRCVYQYGSSNTPFVSVIYFRSDELKYDNTRRFDTNWDGLFTETTIGTARQSLQAVAIDNRGNASAPKTVTKTFGANFRAPLGVRRYEFQVQRAKIGDTKPLPNGTWYEIHTALTTKAVYNINGAEGKLFFRVRAVDLSGLVTDWAYESGISFDPLTPPAAPKPTYTSTTTSVRVTWAATARAESYEYKVAATGAWNKVTAREFTRTGLKSATDFTYYVRAVNRVGVSAWVGIQTRTKTARVTQELPITQGKSWNQKSAWNTSNGKKYVMQGEWCEIEGSPNQIKSVPAGHCWGGNKGMWIFDSATWRTRLAGKRIIKVEIYVHRQGGQHGYYNNQNPTFWMHNYTNFPAGQPSLFARFQPPDTFSLGDKGWVTLPNYYGEYIRDNKAKGIGTYRDNWTKLPYIKFYPSAKLRITYE